MEYFESDVKGLAMYNGRRIVSKEYLEDWSEEIGEPVYIATFEKSDDYEDSLLVYGKEIKTM